MIKRGVKGKHRKYKKGKAVEKFQGNNLADFQTDTILLMLGETLRIRR